MSLPNNLLPTRIEQRNGFAHGEYFLKAQPGVTAADIVSPDYWINLAERLRVNDRIEVVAIDGSFDLDLRVVAVDPRGLYARVRVLNFIEGDGIEVPGAEPTAPAGPPPIGIPDRDGYVIEPDANPNTWRVMHGRDLIAGKLPTEAAAIEAREAARAGKPVKKAS